MLDLKEQECSVLHVNFRTEKHGEDDVTAVDLKLSANMPPSVLAERAHLDRARTSRAISTLVEKQLVTRTTAPSDRRGARLALTVQGQRLYQDLMPEVQEINRRILSVLSPEDMVQLDSYLARLHASAQTLKSEIAPELPKTYRLRGRKSAGDMA